MVTAIAFPADAERAVGVTVARTIEAFLASIRVAATRTDYGETLARLVQIAGSRLVAELTTEDFGGVMDRWDTAAAACAGLPARRGRRASATRRC